MRWCCRRSTSDRSESRDSRHWEFAAMLKILVKADLHLEMRETNLCRRPIIFKEESISRATMLDARFL
jgi:hypothetical protein